MSTSARAKHQMSSSVRGKNGVFLLAKANVVMFNHAHAAVVVLAASVPSQTHPYVDAEALHWSCWCRRKSNFCNPYANKGLNETSLKVLAVRGNSH